MKSWVLMLGLAGLVVVPATGQGLKRPESWRVRLDDGLFGPIPDSLYYVSMPPGWHATTRRFSGIFWDPAWRASGNFRISSTMFLFPGSREEGYGLFFAGRDLEGAGQSYLYFLLRRDGKFLIKHRRGAEAREIVAWTDSPAITKLAADGKDNVKNVIVIEASGDRIRFLVNGQELTSLPRVEVDGRGEGVVGLRLNHGIDLHVTEVKIEPLG
jgi:hypothetical protein